MTWLRHKQKAWKKTESWGEDRIEDKINPKCIDISDQASHSFYNNKLDIWFEPDEEIFPEGCDEWELNGLIETNGISDDEVFDLLYEGANNYKKNLRQGLEREISRAKVQVIV